MSEGNNRSQTKEIYKAIIGITEDLIKEGGIGKTRMNEQQKFRFRGIEDIQNALAPLLVKHKVCIVPTFANRRTEQHESRTGGKLFSTVVDGVFDLISAVDGSSVRVTIPGEAMDTGDKSTNKAMSMAMKYASLLTFCIPTEGEDADATAHDLKNGRKAASDVCSAATGPTPMQSSAIPPTGVNGAHNGSGASNGAAPPAGPSSTSSLAPPQSKRALRKVVQINGKRIRTAGIDAEQLLALWKIAGTQGKEKVGELIKIYGVEKSIYLTKEEAQEVLGKLNGISPEEEPKEDLTIAPI
jgi:ERF superfamily